MTLKSIQLDWRMESRYHRFPTKSSDVKQVAKFLSYLKEYDDACKKARTEMHHQIKVYDITCKTERAILIKKIKELIGDND
jgi:hypothetical protein